MDKQNFLSKEMPKEMIAEILKLENQMCFPLYAAARLVVQSYDPVLKKLDLTYPKYLVLLTLWEKDGLSVKEIGERLFLDSGTLTPLLNKLSKKGFIKRKRSKTDSRTVYNYLTESGERLKYQAIEVPLELACKSKFSPKDALKLRDLIKELLKQVSIDIKSEQPRLSLEEKFKIIQSYSET